MRSFLSFAIPAVAILIGLYGGRLLWAYHEARQRRRARVAAAWEAWTPGHIEPEPRTRIGGPPR